jgi:hypothetical protein
MKATLSSQPAAMVTLTKTQLNNFNGVEIYNVSAENEILKLGNNVIFGGRGLVIVTKGKRLDKKKTILIVSFALF